MITSGLTIFIFHNALIQRLCHANGLASEVWVIMLPFTNLHTSWCITIASQDMENIVLHKIRSRPHVKQGLQMSWRNLSYVAIIKLIPLGRTNIHKSKIPHTKKELAYKNLQDYSANQNILLRVFYPLGSVLSHPSSITVPLICITMEYKQQCHHGFCQIREWGVMSSMLLKQMGLKEGKYSGTLLRRTRKGNKKKYLCRLVHNLQCKQADDTMTMSRPRTSVSPDHASTCTTVRCTPQILPFQEQSTNLEKQQTVWSSCEKPGHDYATPQGCEEPQCGCVLYGEPWRLTAHFGHKAMFSVRDCLTMNDQINASLSKIKTFLFNSSKI